MSTILCTEKNVAVDSLPRSLRHMSQQDVLFDAKILTRFLYDVSTAASAHPDVFEADGWGGMSLVLDLLRDKIDIASGEYSFPHFAHGEDVPSLVERSGS